MRLNLFAFYLQANTELKEETLCKAYLQIVLSVFTERVGRALPWVFRHPGKETGRAESFKFLVLFPHNSDSRSFRKRRNETRDSSQEFPAAIA